jgi:hypothetical protein
MMGVMLLVRFLVASATITSMASVAGCGLNAAGEVSSDASAGTKDARIPRKDSESADSPHMTRADAAADVRTADGSAPPDDARVDTGADAPTPRDANVGTDANPPPCSASAPDCMNPNCTEEGYMCVPAAPSDWTLAAVDFANPSACPAGYMAGAALKTAPTSSPAICGCGVCTVETEPSCTNAALMMTVSFGATCNAPFQVAAGGCGEIGFNGVISSNTQVSNLPGPTGGTCTAPVTKTVPGDGSTSVYVCKPTTSPPNTGCSAGSVCTATTAARSKCVVTPTATACPSSGYTNANTVGTGVSDTRGCSGGCACTAPTGTTCDDGLLTYYTGADCSGTGYALTADGSCDPVTMGVGVTVVSYEYSADPAGATCGTPTSTRAATGSATLSGVETLCCE